MYAVLLVFLKDLSWNHCFCVIYKWFYKAIEDVIARHFGNDTALMLYEKDLNTLVEAVSWTVQKICRWCIQNQLTISIERTNLVLFRTPNKSLVKNLREIETEAMAIKRVDKVTYLGVNIDEKLTWNAHVENVRNFPIKFFVI